MTPEELGMTPEEIAKLDTMTPVQRHELLDYLHEMHAAVESFKESALSASRAMDTVAADIASQRQFQRTESQHEALTDLLMSHTLMAESLAALAQGDLDRARDIQDMAKPYSELPIRIRLTGGVDEDNGVDGG